MSDKAVPKAAVEREYLTTRDIAMMLGVSLDVVRGAIGRGELRAKKLGSAKNARIIIHRRWVEDWIESLPDTGGEDEDEA